MQSQGNDVTQVETFTPFVSREWLYNRCIVYHTISDSSRASIQEARKMFLDSMGKWSATQLYLAVNDFSSPNMSFSPTMQQALREIRQVRPELKGYIAIVMPKGFVSQIIRLFVRSNPGVRANELFYTREEAINWLLKKMSPQDEDFE